MTTRILICFPLHNAPGLQAEAAQLALGLATLGAGYDVVAMGPLGPWRHTLRLAGITAEQLSLPINERRLTEAIQRHDPQVIHTFGVDAANLAIPLTMLVGACGAATLGHEDVTRLQPAHLRTASVLFVPCEQLRESLARRLPHMPVITTGNLLPPAAEVSRLPNRFLAEDLGLEDGAPVVLLADYFHAGETNTALMLISTVPQLEQQMSGVQLVIAGSGPRLAELEQAAEEMNTQLGRRAVLLPGDSSEMPLLLALATIAVGSGRFAMEAAGAGVPLVMAGPAGLLGTLTEDTRAEAHATCAARHGRLQPLTPQALATEITGLYRYSDYRERFAREEQAALLAEGERTARAAQIAAYYTPEAPGAISKAPQRITAFLPEDLRALLFTLPAITGLRAKFPLARLQLVTAPAHQALLRRLDLAESVVTRPQRLKEGPAFLRALRRARPDVCLAFTGEHHTHLLAALTFAPHRLGFAEGSSSIVLSDHLHLRTQTGTARTLTLVHALGITEGAPIPAPEIPAETRDVVDLSLLAAGVAYQDPFILLCPQAEETRAWPRSQWQSLIKLLAEDRPERIAVLGPEGYELPEGVVPVVPVQESLVLAALLQRASLVVAPDSGALHLAAVMGTPTVGIYGPTTPETCSLPHAHAAALRQRDYPCHPCAGSACQEHRCLRAHTPGDVANAIERVLSTVAVAP